MSSAYEALPEFLTFHICCFSSKLWRPGRYRYQVGETKKDNSKIQGLQLTSSGVISILNILNDIRTMSEQNCGFNTVSRNLQTHSIYVTFIGVLVSNNIMCAQL